MNRTTMREQAFKLEYSLGVQEQENIDEAIELFLESNEITEQNAIEYIKSTIFGIEKNKEEIIKQITKNL